ncbi:MAG: chromosome segregation protein SMC, partial [Venatoribacter sp.]
MRLKAIKLAGFKSFVDPTTVPFSTNMTGIVGPNGCGKSNTIDAVRWVMGESSAKYLRGDAMTDVIFNGSAERKPVGKASVELVFDNSDKTLKGEYAAYNEISLRRQVSRDGQSLYFLNGTKCRRKDITDIFLGTGLGPRSYAIIEQGMISRLIEAKPEELRVYVEEAAGISKYKERRRETENRIRRTEENLERLGDIQQELERQLAHLQRQAAAAEKYKEYKAQEREKKAQLQALKWQVLDADYRQRELAIAQHETQYQAHLASQQQADTQIEVLRQEHYEKSEQFNQAQNRFYQVGAQIARQEQKIEHQAQMSLQLNRELQDVEKSLFDLDQALEHDQLHLESRQEELAMFEPELELLIATQEECNLAVLNAEETQQTIQKEWEAFSLRASEPAKQADIAQAKIQATEQQLQRIASQIQRLQEELNQLSHNPEIEEIHLLSDEVNEFELQNEAQQEQFESLQEQLHQGREHLDALIQKHDQAKSQLQHCEARQATLQALQKAALGHGTEAIQRWLEGQQLARKPKLLEQIQVEKGWEIAVETVLGRYLQAVLVDDFSHAEHWFSSLKEGELTLWCRGATPASSSSGLLSKVQSQHDLSGFLADVQIADTLIDALAIQANLQTHQSVITREGIWLGKHWLRVSKAADNEGGVLARQQELERLETQIEDLDIQVDEWEVDLNAAKLRLKNIEQQRDLAAREQQQISQKLIQLKAQLSGKQARVEQFQQRSNRLHTEIAEQQELQNLEREHLEELRLQWQQALSHIDSDSSERERWQQQRLQAQQQLDTARQQERESREHLHQVQLKAQGLRNQEHSLLQAIARLQTQKQQLLDRKEQLHASQNQDHSADLAELKLVL